jgi:hypothetical protein
LQREQIIHIAVETLRQQISVALGMPVGAGLMRNAAASITPRAAT